MPCYKPLKGYWSKHKTANGRRKVVFSTEAGFVDMPIEIQCGQCTGCRLERSRQWAVRCVHEASLHEDNAFLTLTYNDDSLPKDRSLDVTHFQKFMKRYRKAYPGIRIRFFHCGEYGDLNRRPHYHAIIFGHDFDDKELHTVKNGYKIYTSEKLKKLWPYGYNTIGSVTFESAAYVARYVMKKRFGADAEEYYWVPDPETGEMKPIKPEYVTMSRRPGIGKKWYDQFKNDAYPKDFITIRGKSVKPPRYYDNLLFSEDEHKHQAIKDKRRKDAKQRKEDNTYERLRQREKCKQLQIKTLHRNLED